MPLVRISMHMLPHVRQTGVSTRQTCQLARPAVTCAGRHALLGFSHACPAGGQLRATLQVGVALILERAARPGLAGAVADAARILLGALGPPPLARRLPAACLPGDRHLHNQHQTPRHRHTRTRNRSRFA